MKCIQCSKEAIGTVWFLYHGTANSVLDAYPACEKHADLLMENEYFEGVPARPMGFVPGFVSRDCNETEIFLRRNKILPLTD